MIAIDDLDAMADDTYLREQTAAGELSVHHTTRPRRWWVSLDCGAPSRAHSPERAMFYVQQRRAAAVRQARQEPR